MRTPTNPRELAPLKLLIRSFEVLTDVVCIAAELAGLGLALPGTLLQRSVRCGWAGCRCHADPPELHGPYWQWTRKRAGRTVSRLVPDDQVDDYRQWIDNHRRLRELVAELEDLTLAVADQRAGRHAPARQTRQNTA